MSGDVADKSEPRHSFATRGRRALRVPISEIPRARLLDDASLPIDHDGGVDDATDLHELEVDWDETSGVNEAAEVDRDPTEPSFRTE
ncbi:MAG: hypothetical protein AAF997_17340, partial [Myxococcota bacterium]